VTTLVATTSERDDVMRHGTPIGFLGPIDATDRATDRATGRAALGRLGEAVNDVLERTGMDEDQLVDELSTARSRPS
jgi:hypothetical protein